MYARSFGDVPKERMLYSITLVHLRKTFPVSSPHLLLKVPFSSPLPAERSKADFPAKMASLPCAVSSETPNLDNNNYQPSYTDGGAQVFAGKRPSLPDCELVEHRNESFQPYNLGQVAILSKASFPHLFS